MDRKVNTTPHPAWHPPMTLETMGAILGVCDRVFGSLVDGVKAPIPVAGDYHPVDGHVNFARLRELDGTKYIHAFVKVKHVPTRSYWIIDWFQDDVFLFSAETIRKDTLTMREMEVNGRSFLGDKKFSYKYARHSFLYPLREEGNDARW